MRRDRVKVCKGGNHCRCTIERLIISFGATGIARYGLNVKEVRDPMSGFFALPRHVLKDIEFNTKGFKILLEILVKKQRHVTVKEIPYTFTVRKYGYSKLDLKVLVDYTKAVWSLYRVRKKITKKAGRFREQKILVRILVEGCQILHRRSQRVSNQLLGFFFTL